MRTGNDEVMNANHDLDDQQTLTDLSLDKTRALYVMFSVPGLKFKDL